MRFHIRHHTRYVYSQPVHCDPLEVRLRPRDDFRQRLLAFALDIDPAPAGIAESIDLEGNHVVRAWFAGSTEHLTVTASIAAETRDVNPFHFLLRSDAARLPLVPSASEERHFEAYARPLSRCTQLDEVVHELAREVEYAAVPFLCRLNEWICAAHEKTVRHEGPPWRPSETLCQRRGSCRDLAVLFIEGCRLMNVPARFVSGYGAGTDDALDRQLHAWAEVYLPGAGWRGFDPSLGLAVTDRHLAVATGRTPADAAPTTGTFRGNAESRLEAEIEMVTSANELREIAIGDRESSVNDVT